MRIAVVAAVIVMLGAVACRGADSPRPLDCEPLAGIVRHLELPAKTRVVVDPAVGETVVCWRNPGMGGLRRQLGVLAELTGALLQSETAASGMRTYTLRKPVDLKNAEDRWFTASLMKGMRDIADPTRATGESRDKQAIYSRFPHTAPLRKVFSSFTPEQLKALMEGEEVGVPTERIPEAERLALERDGLVIGPPGLDPERAKRAQSDQAAIFRASGLTFSLKQSSNADSACYVMARAGAPHTSSLSGLVVGVILARNLEMPALRRNAYELLRNGWLEKELAGEWPPAADERKKLVGRSLAQELEVVGEETWRDAIARFGKAAGIEVVSDDYLARNERLRSLRPDDVRLAAGTSAAEALDRLCARFHCVWWEKEGVAYCRSSTWPRETLREVPPSVLERIRQDVQGGRLTIGTLEAVGKLGRSQRMGFGRLVPRDLDDRDTRALGVFDTTPLTSLPKLDPTRKAALLGQGLELRAEDVELFPNLRRYTRVPGPVTVRFVQPAAEQVSRREDGMMVPAVFEYVRGGKVAMTERFAFYVPNFVPQGPGRGNPR